jgi:hypothetical protein
VKSKYEYVKLILNAERQVKLDVLLSSPIVTACGLIWAAAPFINKNPTWNIDDRDATTGDHNLERMIFVMWTPFEIGESPQFEIIILLQIIIVSLAVFQLYAVDIMFLSLMSHTAAQLKLLSSMLNVMHQEISENSLHATTVIASQFLTADGTFVNQERTSADGSTSLQSWSGINEHSGNHSTQMVCPKDDALCDDPFRQHLVKCIKHHQAIIK